MPKLPSGGMQLPGGFGGGPQFQPIRDKMSSVMHQDKGMMQKMVDNTKLPLNMQQMIQAIMGNYSGSKQPQMPSNTDQSAGGGSFWNPNDGVQRPTIDNTPSTTNPTSPFAMPQNNVTGGGVPPPLPSGGNRWTNFVPPPQSPNYNIK